MSVRPPRGSYKTQTSKTSASGFCMTPRGSYETQRKGREERRREEKRREEKRRDEKRREEKSVRSLAFSCYSLAFIVLASAFPCFPLLAHTHTHARAHARTHTRTPDRHREMGVAMRASCFSLASLVFLLRFSCFLWRFTRAHTHTRAKAHTHTQKQTHAKEHKTRTLESKRWFCGGC